VLLPPAGCFILVVHTYYGTYLEDPGNVCFASRKKKSKMWGAERQGYEKAKEKERKGK
jgi:hypothetical protein